MGYGLNNNMAYGEAMYRLCKEIFPICRSITGDGVRQTLRMVSDYVGTGGLQISEIPSGTQVFDWTVPKEWSVKEAYIEDECGNRIVDFKKNNLHVVGYSCPVDTWVELDELKKHIHTQDDQPAVIPYVTSYYRNDYGFCMSKNDLDALQPGRYHMYIDSRLFDGNMTYAEAVIPGATDEEILFSTNICHPSMADNECSGPALEAELIRFVKTMKNRRYTYRFLFVPETIGAVAYLAADNHLREMKDKVKAGFVLTCVGDDREYSMVESRYADTLADRILSNVLDNYTENYKRYSFMKRGSDERQYGASGVDLPVVTFCRSKFHTYAEYHTSADDMRFISPAGLQGSYDVMVKVIELLENNDCYRTTVLCEPQLGKRGLYPTTSQKNTKGDAALYQDILAYADGTNDIVDLCGLTGRKSGDIIKYIKTLMDNGLIKVKGM